MKNLFNINISNIRYNGSDVLLIKHNGDVIYEKLPLYVPYEFRGSKESIIRTMVSTPHTDLSYMFADCNNLIYTNAQDWNTSNVTNMNRMFAGCYSLYSVDMSNWDTSNVTNMAEMFYGCTGFYSSLDVSSFNTSNVTNMNHMFSACYNITELDVSNFSTGKVINMSHMFSSCGLTELDVSNWDTSNVTTIDSMFSNCQDLALLDVSNWDTGNVTTIDKTFSYCYKLASLDVSNWDTSSVTSMNSTFAGCDALTTLDLSNWDFTNVTTANNMFYNCSSLCELRLDNCDNKDILAQIISQLPSHDIDGVATRIVYCKKSVASTASIIMPYGWTIIYVYEEPSERPLYDIGQFINNTEITEVDILVDSTHTDLSYMFSGCTNLTSVNTEGWDTSNVTNMTCMFDGCSSLTEFDMVDFDSSSSSVRMAGMFRNCTALTTLDVLSNRTITVNHVGEMFKGCSQLVTLNLSAISMAACGSDAGATTMFTDCTALTNLVAPKQIRTSIDVSYCPNLTHDSLMSIINNLDNLDLVGGNYVRTLKLGGSNYLKLTTEEFNIAKNKGWNVAV